MRIARACLLVLAALFLALGVAGLATAEPGAFFRAAGAEAAVSHLCKKIKERKDPQ